MPIPRSNSADDNAAHRLRLAVLDGDGIGPEIVSACSMVISAVLRATGLDDYVKFVSLPMGRLAIAEFGTPIPESTLTALAGTDGWIMGPHDSAGYPEPWRQRLNPS